MSRVYFDVDRCVMCGEIVDEGRQVCPNCENTVNQQHRQFLAEQARREAEQKKHRFRRFFRK